ncbi:PRC-barrel domain containing protein [Niveispirillum sp. KHB5.9]|uniref:PRC-barrel domain containing protein n=1 Tax=Niveispirillum sp. KHB5.9 TaxID=3400269 RepID=UPI003A8BAA36
MDLEAIAGVIAPAATMVAAMMTAANLGARVTGWGFVVFALGSVCWAVVGFVSGQANLLWTNLFLVAVNMVGVWRWLGRKRAYEDGGKSAIAASRRSEAPTLLTASGIAGTPVQDVKGVLLGKAVEALIECDTGRVSYVVVATEDPESNHESLRAVPRSLIDLDAKCLTMRLTEMEFRRLKLLESGDWPAAIRSVQAVF